MDLLANQCHLVGSFKTFIEKAKRITILNLSSFTQNVCIVILTFCISLAGTLLGGSIGVSKCGCILGATAGAISGLMYSIVVFEYSLPLGQSGQTVIDNLSYLIDDIGSTVSGSLWREWLSAELLSAMESRWNDDGIMRFNGVQNIFDVGGAQGLSEDSIAKIPKITVTSNDNVDSTSGERDVCSVCLQDFEVGETVRSLPGCHHMFHITCIHKWLTMHGSCPLCRRVL